MVSFPNWTDPQFLDAAGVGGLNAAMGTVSGAIAGVGSGAWAVPGLLAPEAMTVGFASLVANIGLPQPWGLVSSSGAVVRAHGTQTGVDTTSYSVNFASLVPGTGSVTAFLAATITQIQQNPFAITGPPPGDPAYNPNFVPTTGYATNQYSVALAAVSGGINNTTTFELFRTTLTAGQSSISAYNTAFQVRAGDRKAWPGAVLASGGVLIAAQAQSMLSPGVSGLTNTLPLVSGAGGLVYGFVNPTSGSWTVAASGADTIVGFGTSMSIPALGAALLWGNAASGTWNPIAVNPSNNAIAGSMTNAVMLVSAASATATFTADEIIVQTVLGGAAYSLASFNQNINLATTGAGGMDTGSAPSNGFVALYAIYNPTTATVALLGVNATSAAAPTIYGGSHMPSGYTASALVSVWGTNVSGQFIAASQRNRHVNFTPNNTFTTGTANGSVAALSVAAQVPPNAVSVLGNVNATTTGGPPSTNAWQISSNAAGFGDAASATASNQTQTPYSIYLITPQTIYWVWIVTGATPSNMTISVGGYDF